MTTRYKFDFSAPVPELVPEETRKPDMNQALERTERAFEAFALEHKATFDALNMLGPKLSSSMRDLARACFLGGVNYELKREIQEAREAARVA